MVAERRLRSLFIVSLPRSLSTVVHTVCCAALGLEGPLWTSAGEILNGERVVVTSADDSSRRFMPPEKVFVSEQLHAFLDDVVKEHGIAYKDVTQPFVVAAWLRQRPMPSLRIRRPLADVAWSMLAAGWWYPELAGGAEGTRERRMLTGLVRASRALATIQAETVDFDALVQGESALEQALERLYPGHLREPLHYLDDKMRQTRDSVLARRQTQRWQELRIMIDEIEADLPRG